MKCCKYKKKIAKNWINLKSEWEALKNKDRERGKKKNPYNSQHAQDRHTLLSMALEAITGLIDQHAMVSTYTSR